MRKRAGRAFLRREAGAALHGSPRSFGGKSIRLRMTCFGRAFRFFAFARAGSQNPILNSQRARVLGWGPLSTGVAAQTRNS